MWVELNWVSFPCWMMWIALLGDMQLKKGLLKSVWEVSLTYDVLL